MKELKTKVRVCKNSVLQILSPNDPAQLQMFGVTKYSVKNLRYDKVWRSKGYIKVQQGGKQGLFDQSGKQILPIDFDKILIYERGFVCSKNNISKFYQLDGSVKMSASVSIEMYFHKLGIFLVRDLFRVHFFTLQREDGSLINNEEFDSYIDLPDKVLLRYEYHQRRLLFDKKTGSISWVSSKVYAIGESDADAVIYKINDKTGLILRRGRDYKEIIKPGVYDKIEVKKLERETFFGCCVPTRVKVYRNDKCGVVDWQGNVFVPCIYDEIYEQKNLGIVVIKNGKKGLFTNKKRLSCKYDDVYKPPYCDSRVFVCKNNLWGVAGDGHVDEIILPMKFSAVYATFKMGYSVVVDGKWGFYDFDGKQILPFLYDSLMHQDSFWVVGISSDDKTRVGVADKNGKLIVPIEYENVNVCKGGFIVKKELGYGLYSSEGKELLSDNYDAIEQIVPSFYRIYHKGKYGVYFSKKRKMIIPIKYSWVDIDEEGYLFAKTHFMQVLR